MSYKYDFDEIIDRENTDSLKYDFAAERGMPEDLLSLWVADMDIRAPKEINEAIIKMAEHGIYGYSDTKDDYFEALRNWYSKRHGWDISEEWLVKTPGVVFAVATAVKAYTEKGDAVLIQEPVYYPFSGVIEANERKLVNNSLVYDGEKYSIDFEDFEKKIVEEKVKMFILCSPHNPVGRVWDLDELERMGDICLKHNVLVVSDEIHADFVFPGKKHIVFSKIKKEFEDNVVICTAPSKTFNIAGLQVSNIFIPNSDLRLKFREELNRVGYSQLNNIGLAAAKAAYQYGENWLEQLMEYLASNFKFMDEFLKTRIPEIKLVKPEGTYLAWLDCRGLGISDEEIEDLIVNKAKLWLDGGTMFGKDGEYFQRVNIACPKATLEKALLQLEEAVKSIRA